MHPVVPGAGTPFWPVLDTLLPFGSSPSPPSAKAFRAAARPSL